MDVPHYCTGCGQPHGGHGGESDEVKIAKINRDADIEIARLARSEARQEIEAEVEQTEIIAEAAVVEAVVEAAVLEEVLTPDPAPVPDAPVVIESAPDPEPEVEAVPEPPETTEPPKSGKKDTGWWAGYR